MTLSNQAGKHMRNQFRNQIRDQKGLATWVKVLIGVMIVGTISIIGLIAGGVFFFGSAMKDIMDPAKVKTTAESIAKFSEPLPTGWKFGMALNMFGTSVAMLNNEKDNMTVTLLKLPRTGKEISSDEVIEGYADKGVPNMSGVDPEKTSAKVNIKDRGKLTVGGEEMNYVTGYSERGGKKFSQLIGCVMPKSTQNAVIIQGVCLDSEDYKLAQTKALLNSIKGF